MKTCFRLSLLSINSFNNNFKSMHLPFQNECWYTLCDSAYSGSYYFVNMSLYVASHRELVHWSHYWLTLQGSTVVALQIDPEVRFKTSVTCMRVTLSAWARNFSMAFLQLENSVSTNVFSFFVLTWSRLFLSATAHVWHITESLSSR